MARVKPMKPIEAMAEADARAEALAAIPAPDGRKLSKLARKEIARVCQYLVEDPVFLEELQRRLRTLQIHPAILTTIMAYAYGKPKERIEVKQATVVKIIHEFAGAETPPVIDGTVVVPPPALPPSHDD